MNLHPIGIKLSDSIACVLYKDTIFTLNRSGFTGSYYRPDKGKHRELLKAMGDASNERIYIIADRVEFVDISRLILFFIN